MTEEELDGGIARYQSAVDQLKAFVRNLDPDLLTTPNRGLPNVCSTGSVLD